MIIDIISFRRTIDNIFIILLEYIGWIVIIYTDYYMRNEEKREEFKKNIYIFILIMKHLILVNSFYDLFYYWESIGIFSYILINYWGKKKESIKTIIYNRIGDLSILYLIIKEEVNRNNSNLMYFNKSFSIFIFLALIIKSVQFFSFPWLLNAMVSPTPVSSLLHSATMVCSGIYICIKYNYKISVVLFSIYLIISLLIGLGLKDIKKIIAISTSNNINLLFINLKKFSYIHMLNHGLIKSLIFLLSGFIIHNNLNQDIRKMRGYIYKEPLLLKLFLFLFIPLPYIFIFNSKEYLFLSSSSYFLNYIYNYLYLSFSFFLYKYLKSRPSYTYYLKSTDIYIYLLFIIPSFFFSLFLPFFFNSYSPKFLDLIYIIVYLLPFYSINTSIEKHNENIINKLIYKFLLI